MLCNRNYKFLALLFFAILLNLFVGAQLFGMEKLQVVVGFDKEVYLLDEPIFLKFHLRNVGSETLRYKYNGPQPYFIKDSKGKVYKYYGPQVMRGTTAGEEIKPGETIEKGGYDLLENYGELPPVKKNYFLPLVRRYLPPEVYTVQASFYLVDYYGGPEQIKTTLIKSNIAKFTVVEPTGDEEEAHRLLKRAYESQYKKDDEDEALHYHESLVNSYPKSVYAPLALSIERLIYSQKDFKKEQEIRKEIIDRYPNSFYAVQEVRATAVNYANLFFRTGHYDQEEIINELKHIAEKHKGTKVEPVAKEMIERVKQGKEFNPLKEIEKQKQRKERRKERNEQEKH